MYVNVSKAETDGYYYLFADGHPPSGLTLNAMTGVLSSMPSANGTFSFTVVATGQTGCSGSKAYSIVIAPGACPTITLPALPEARWGNSTSDA